MTAWPTGTTYESAESGGGDSVVADVTWLPDLVREGR